MNFQDGRSLGFIAQDLKEVLPEAVQTEANGYYSVNYLAIIPVLVEAIKEQNTAIQRQDSIVKYLQAKLSSSSTNNTLVQSYTVQNNAPSLFQNQPNPFNQQTTIGYYLPIDVKIASLIIFDLQGKLIKTIPINNRENSSIVINANELNPGIFIYSLIADGKEVDYKRMILTE